LLRRLTILAQWMELSRRREEVKEVEKVKEAKGPGEPKMLTD